MRVVLGLDTSCYTTSCGLAMERRGLDQARRLLDVPLGERGLQQSKGVFQHVGRMPALIEALLSRHADAEIVGVCASIRPRPVEGSYMPVFTVGEGHGRTLAATLRVPFIETSHQQGHIRAAMWTTPLTPGDRFLALHLSGGTTEIVVYDEGAVRLIGGTNDLHAGQFIDRVGVALGLSFPAGPELEKLACRGQAKAGLPIWVRGTTCSFSGSESAAQRMIAADELSREDMAAEVFSCVARSIAKVLVNAVVETGVERILLAGGVTSSILMRDLISARVKRLNPRVKLYWGQPEFSGDNACGAALIGADTLGIHCELSE
ncbi:MAG: O-sialoglycoprotein endopeptidase [Clostridia bacterium]|nr:O-sialoglycoprotein endopeptidase [Clostridia bacterium]